MDENWQDVPALDDQPASGGWATGRDKHGTPLWSCAINGDTYVALTAARLYVRYANVVPWRCGPPPAEARLRHIDIDENSTVPPADAINAGPLTTAPWEAWLNSVVAFILRRVDTCI
jgi:hypothetical protein